MVRLLSNFKILYRGEESEATYKKMSMTRLTPKLNSLMTLISPKSSKCNISMNNGQIALKFCTGVQSQ